MIYKDITVKIPDKKRIRKSDMAVYEILARKGKDSEKDIVRFVGKAISDTEMNPGDGYFKLHPENRENFPLKVPEEFSFALNIGSRLLILQAARKSGMVAALKEVFGEDEDMILSLVSCRLLCGKHSLPVYASFVFSHYTGLKSVPSEQTLSRLFNERLNVEAIEKFFKAWHKHKAAPKKISVNFIPAGSDGFTGDSICNESMQKTNIVCLSDQETGVPFYYGLCGPVPDIVSVLDQISGLKNKPSDTLFVLSDECFSEDVVNYIENNGYSFLCTEKSGEFAFNAAEEYDTAGICKETNRIINSVYGIKTEADFSGRKMHACLFYNGEADMTSYNMTKTGTEKICTLLPGKKDENGNIRKTYGKYINITTDENDVITSAEPDKIKQEKYKRSLKFFRIISDRDFTPKEALLHYMKNEAIKKAFLSSKSDFSLLERYSGTESAYDAGRFIGFLSAVIQAGLCHGLKSAFRELNDEAAKTALFETDKIIAEKGRDRYIQKYALTDRQKQILAVFDMDADDVLDLISEINDRLT